MATLRTRRDALSRAITDIAAATDAGDSSPALGAVKHGLEAIHELADCATRGEWSKAGWNTDDEGLWCAHIGARNAAHHQSSGVVTLETDARGTSLIWHLEPHAVTALHTKRPGQADEYERRLAGQPVLPTVRAVLTLVTAAVP